MIAVLTTIAVAEVGPDPTAASEAASASSSAWRVASTSAAADFRRISCASPGWLSAPYQNSPSVRANRSGARPRRRCSGPNSKNAYASSRACSAFPYSPARAAATTRSSEARMTSKSAAACPSFHSLGKVDSARSSASWARSRTVSSSVTRTPCDAAAMSAAEGGHELVDAGGGGRVALDQPAVEVCESLRGAVAERHGLLDLERERHAPVGDAAAVLDRDEREEAEELSGAADLLRRREGAARKASSASSTCAAARSTPPLVPRERRVVERFEGRRCASRRRPRRAAGRRSPGGRRSSRGRVRSRRRAWTRSRAPRPRRRRRAPFAAAPGTCRGSPRARPPAPPPSSPARRRALATARVASAPGRENLVGGRYSRTSSQRPASAASPRCERGEHARGRRRASTAVCRVALAAASLTASRPSTAASTSRKASSSALVRQERRRAASRPAWRVAPPRPPRLLAENERPLGLREMRPQRRGRLPRRLLRGGVRAAVPARPRATATASAAARAAMQLRYCSISTPSWAAAWETWPAIAVRTLLRLGSERVGLLGREPLPACSRSWRSAMNARGSTAPVRSAPRAAHRPSRRPARSRRRRPRAR